MRMLCVSTIVCLILVTVIYYKVADRPAFAALAQAWATIVLVAVTVVYVVEVGRGSAPMVGVTGVRPLRFLKDAKVDNYEGVAGFKIHFQVENLGTRPAKNSRISTKGKIGNTVLPYTESEGDAGVTIFPGVKVFNIVVVSKGTLDRLVLEKERLIYTVDLSYTDWEGHHKYENPQSFQVKVSEKDPLNLKIGLVKSPAS